MRNGFKVLHEKAVQITQQYLRAESELISILQKIDDCQGYRELGFKSLFDYATQSLKLSESVTCNLITVARKAREVPKLKEMIQNREISISNARTIAPVLTQENQSLWLEAAASLSKRALEKEIAKQIPHAAVQERLRPVAQDRIELKMGMSEKLHEKLKHAQDLVSSQSQKAASLEETLEALVDLFIEKKDPFEKAKRAEGRAGKKLVDQVTSSEVGVTQSHSPVPGHMNLRGHVSFSENPKNIGTSDSRYVPAQIEHAVRLRDRNQCTHKNPNGTRCREKRWLDIHHIQPLSQGGMTTLNNLTLVCRGHHQLQHRAQH